MDQAHKLCMGCMNELDRHGVCRYCSYTDDIPHLQSYLAPRTVLDDRYIVGKMLSYNGEGASYICYDMVRKCKARHPLRKRARHPEPDNQPRLTCKIQDLYVRVRRYEQGAFKNEEP